MATTVVNTSQLKWVEMVTAAEEMYGTTQSSLPLSPSLSPFVAPRLIKTNIRETSWYLPTNTDTDWLTHPSPQLSHQAFCCYPKCIAALMRLTLAGLARCLAPECSSDCPLTPVPLRLTKDVRMERLLGMKPTRCASTAHNGRASKVAIQL